MSKLGRHAHLHGRDPQVKQNAINTTLLGDTRYLLEHSAHIPACHGQQEGHRLWW